MTGPHRPAPSRDMGSIQAYRPPYKGKQ